MTVYLKPGFEPYWGTGCLPPNSHEGHEGLIGDLQAYVSRSSPTDSAAIPFGHALIRDGAASGDGAKLPLVLLLPASSVSLLTPTPSRSTPTPKPPMVGWLPDKEMVNA